MNATYIQLAIAELKDLGYLMESTVELLTPEEYMHAVTTVQREEMLSR